MAVVETESYISPVGETIEVLDDRSFIRRLGAQPGRAGGQFLKLNANRSAALKALWFEGRIESSSGLAIRVLYDRARKHGSPRSMSALSNAVGQRSLAGCLDINVGVKRTYSIQLVRLPRRWAVELGLRNTIIMGRSATTPPVEPEVIAASTDLGLAGGEGVQLDVSMPVQLESLTPVELEMTNAVATALLTQVVEIISTGNGGAATLSRLQLDFQTVEERLAQQVGYVGQLRKQLREVGDELHAVKIERDGLRQRLRSTEHNLKVATSKQAQRMINDEAQRQIDRVMRQTPIGPNSRVEPEPVNGVPAAP